MRRLFGTNRTFNWISTLLLAGWMILVAVAAESIGHEREVQLPDVGGEVASGILEGAADLICTSSSLPRGIDAEFAGTTDAPQARYLVKR